MGLGRSFRRFRKNVRREAVRPLKGKARILRPVIGKRASKELERATVGALDQTLRTGSAIVRAGKSTLNDGRFTSDSPKRKAKRETLLKALQTKENVARIEAETKRDERSRANILLSRQKRRRKGGRGDVFNKLGSTANDIAGGKTLLGHRG